MRILLTTETSKRVWSFTHALCDELLYRGHQVAVVSFGRQVSHEQQAWITAQNSIYGRSFEFVASHAPLEWMENNEFVLTQGAAALHHVARDFKPDLLHSSQFCYGALTLDVPKVITAHTDVFSWIEACRGRKPEPTRWLRQYRTLVTHGLANADAIVSPSRWMATSLARHGATLPASYVIREGRGLTAAPQSSLRTLQAVTTGRMWDETKNIRMLQDVLTPISIYVAGERKHHQAVAPRQIGKAILLGGLSESALLSLYERSAIYIDCSVYEPSGMDALEAALCGCAVVADDIPPVRELWGDAAIYYRDARELSSILHRLNRNSQELAELQRRATHRAASLNPQRMADGYEAIYQSLTESRTTRRLVAERVAAEAHIATAA